MLFSANKTKPSESICKQSTRTQLIMVTDDFSIFFFKIAIAAQELNENSTTFLYTFEKGGQENI